jgi:hypothetical protein
MYPISKKGDIRVICGEERKAALVEKCELEGRSVTMIINELVDKYLKVKPRKRLCGSSVKYKIARGEK